MAHFLQCDQASGTRPSHRDTLHRLFRSLLTAQRTHHTVDAQLPPFCHDLVTDFPVRVSIEPIMSGPTPEFIDATAGELADRLMALEPVLRRYVHAKASRFQPRVCSDDVIQQVLLQAWRYRVLLGSLRADTLQRWLISTAMNELVSTLRRSGRSGRARDAALLPLGRVAFQRDTPVQQLMKQEFLAQVMGAIALLPERPRRIAQAIWLEGKSPADVAIAEGTTAAAIHCVLSRTRNELKKSMPPRNE